jgi:lysophospholipase L1-like esterase
MKQVVVILALCALGWGTLSAQNSPGNNGGGNGNNSSQAAAMPNWLVVRILHQAQPYFNAQSGINLGQLIQQYRNGNCTIALVATTPPTSNVYRVSFGGALIDVLIDI